MALRFLGEFTRGIGKTYNVIVMDQRQMEAPRQYVVRVNRVLQVWTGSLLLVGLLLLGVLVVTPLRELIPSNGTAALRREARLNTLRVAALEDSLEAQRGYAAQLRRLMIGQVDSSLVASAEPPEPAGLQSGEPVEFTAEPRSQDWQHHEQPALTIPSIPVDRPVVVRTAANEYIARLQFPVLPPVEGFLTRGFDARTGHYAIDIAVEEGSVVRAIGDGYVIFGDWTHEGGYTLAVQHSDGFVSVYKHSQQLLKRVGDRVRYREAVAMSGNSGEITTGPHVHLELWRNGLAQDPRHYFVGW